MAAGGERPGGNAVPLGGALVKQRLVLQRQIVTSSTVVAGAGSGLAGSSPVGPVQSVGDGVLDGRCDAVEQFANFVDGQWYQSGFGLVIDAVFFRVFRVMRRKAAAAMDRVMCRYHASYRRTW